MKKRPITKIKTAFSIDKEVMKAIEKTSGKMKLKKSYIVNEILRQQLLDKNFTPASELQKIKQEKN